MLNFNYIFHFLECGHFCLKHIAKNCDLSLKMDYDKRLMSMYLIKSILKRDFNKVNCYKVSDICGVRSECISVIRTRNNSLHYIVIEKVSDGYIYYYDPLFLFTRKKKIAKFEKKWCKYCCFYA